VGRSDAGASQPDTPAERGRGRHTGRLVATGIVWLMIAYAVGIGLISVIPQVFWPTPSAAAEPVLSGSCDEALLTLERTLLERVSARFQPGREPPTEPDAVWLERWDGHYTALRSRCAHDDDHPYELLGRLRHRIGILLRRFEREQAPLIRRIERSLAPPTPSDTES
jgi:hypothetical protein